ncbi:uncharacterized protein L199_005071 [Kwoniella botswanensis]|uniref:uncharacterized protein n=1 Tax=Kwoniella botswanensis TaxID=1268659 RepID=UPI00315D951A
MDYQYHQEGWGPLQQPFNTFPLYSSFRDTNISDNEGIGSSASLVHSDHEGFSQLPAYPISTIAHHINSGIDLYQPRYVPPLTEIPQTPVHSYIPAIPPSISPRDIHIPRYTGLEVAIPDSSFLPDSAASPLFTYAKKKDEQSIQADTDTESESDSDYGFGTIREVSRNLLNDLTSINSSISQTPCDNQTVQTDIVNSHPVSANPGIISAEGSSVPPSPIVSPALVNPPLVDVNNKKDPVKKRKGKLTLNRKKEIAVAQTPGCKKASSGRQVLLAKKAKPGRRPRPMKPVGGKKSSANVGKSKVKTVTKAAAAPESDSLISFHQSSMTNDDAPKSIWNSSSSSSRSKKSIKLAAASKPRRSSSGIISSPKSGKRKLPPQLSSKVQPKEVIGLGEEDHLSPIPPSPAFVADCSDGEDDDYCPSPFAAETDDELDYDSPPPSATRRKRARSQEEDDEEWTMGKKSNGKKKVKESTEVVESIGEAPPKERQLNKTRNRFYHPGRQEQNVRAQSKYRNKIKARSDLVLEFAQEIFPKVRKTPSAKKLLAKLRDLDHAFATEKFGQL